MNNFELDRLKPTLTDFRGCERVFYEYFKQNKPQNILELGVYNISGVEEKDIDLPGQSTKTLFILHKYFPVKKYVSLDIDDCLSTITRCKQWLRENNLHSVPDHQFVQCNSLDFKHSNYFDGLVDFIFLDTNHDDSYPIKLGYAGSGGGGMTYKEISHIAPMLSRTGSIFLHDTKNRYVEPKYGYNVDGAVERFLHENSGWMFIEHNPNDNGLGELKRKNV